MFSTSGCLSFDDRGPDYTKWRSDFEAAVRHLFPGEKTHIRRLDGILNPPSVYAIGQGYTPPDPDEEAKKRMQQMLAAQALLTSMMDALGSSREEAAKVIQEMQQEIPKHLPRLREAYAKAGEG